MGTQQILLIVLSVIIVGVAIVVGIGMFNRQAYNSNASAIASDAQGFAAEVVQYYKTPVSQGGAMKEDGTVDAEVWTAAKIAARLDNNATGALVKNENGSYTVAFDDDDNVTITGLGTAVRSEKSPQIITTIEFPEGKITAVASDV